MKLIRTRILSAILCASMLFSLSSCQEKTSQDNGDEPFDEEVEKKEESFTLNESYNVVRGEFYEQNEEIISSIQLVREAVAEVYGKAPYLCDDKRRVGDTSVNEFEILVGDTNRDQSQAALKTLGINDFTYFIESKNVIVICGGSPKATLEGVKQFCLDVLGYNTETKQVKEKNPTLRSGESFSYTYDYQYENAEVNGVDINDFVIAIKSDKYKLIGLDAASIFATLSGASIPIVKYSELKGTEKAVICIGATDRSGGAVEGLYTGYTVTNSSENGLLTIGVAVTSNGLYQKAFQKLSDNLVITEKGTGVSISLPAKKLSGTGYEDTTPTWTLSSAKKQTLSDGVGYEERVYVDESNLPYRVYMLTVDPTKAYFYLGTYNDEYIYSTDTAYLQTVSQQINAVTAKGLNVIAATNAQYFSHNSGLVVKEGEVISNSNSARAYFGYTKDGRAVIGEDSINAPISKLQTAVSCYHYIVKDSLPYQLEMENDIGYTSHPRTLIGIKEDGTVVLAVIDGRQKKISNGATLAKCAEFMIAEGCVQALNLDGGGSSTCIIKNGNRYTTKNSPSDGKLRPLPISLMIVKKK